MDIALETLSPSGNVGSKTKAFANSLIFNFLFIDSDLYDVRISDRTPANDPATIMPLNHDGCILLRGVIHAAMSPPLDSPRFASRIFVFRLAFNLCPFSSVHLFPVTSFATGRLMRSETVRDSHLGLATDYSM
jgi:hypothetical protein